MVIVVGRLGALAGGSGLGVGGGGIRGVNSVAADVEGGGRLVVLSTSGSLCCPVEVVVGRGVWACSGRGVASPLSSPRA